MLYAFFPLTISFSRAGAAVLDGYCIPASMLRHKKGFKVFQIWHAMGSFKKFGYAAIGEGEGYDESFARLMNMHENYDVIFTSSEACRENMAKAFNTDIDKFVTIPLPRTDFLMENKYVSLTREKIYDRYPEINNKKKTVLYAPTFRTNADNGKILKEFAAVLDSTKYNLIIKPHPNVKDKVKGEGIYSMEGFSSMECLSVSDVVVTDYSAFILEAAIADKPIYRFVPDKDEYDAQRGFFVDIDREFPGEGKKNPMEVWKDIDNDKCSMDDVRAFADKYVDDPRNCTLRMAEYILRSCHEIK